MTERKKNKQTRTTNLFINNLTLTIMKKNLLILAVAGLALASCSNDETVAVNQGDAISFRPLISNVTRAADASVAIGATFKATAVDAGASTTAYFSNVVFTGAGDPVTFTSTNKYYWPNTKNLDFYAWQPASLVASVGDTTGITVTPGTTIESQPDFVYAVAKNWGKITGNGGNDGKNGVTLNFRHAMSKVLIKLKNSNPNLIITVGNVSIDTIRGSETFTWNGVTNGTTITAKDGATTAGNYTGAGTLTYLNGAWSFTGTQNYTYTIAMGTDDITDDNSDSSARNVFVGQNNTARDLTDAANTREMILIPQELKINTAYASAEENAIFKGANIAVQLKIQNKDNNDYIVGSADTYVKAIWPLTALTWLPGHKYTYTVDLAGGGYFDKNKESSDENLDPILEGAEIKFVTVTVDDWSAATDIPVAGPTE